MKQTLKKLITVIILIFGLTGLKAQETVPASGGEASGSGGSGSYTVGQIVYTTHTGTTGSVAQGVQQPYEISIVTSMEQAKGIMLECSVYPNPATDFLTLKVNASTSLRIRSLSFQLYDINGKLLISENVTADKTEIATNNLTPGNYFLKLTDNKKEIKSFKIMKN